MDERGGTSMERRSQVGDGNESAWEVVPIELMEGILKCACKVRQYNIHHVGYVSDVEKHTRRLQGTIRLVSKQWCKALDGTMRSLKVKWERVERDELSTALRNKFINVEKLEFSGGFTDRLDEAAVERLDSTYSGLPIKHLELSDFFIFIPNEPGSVPVLSLNTLTKLKTLDITWCHQSLVRSAVESISSVTSLQQLTIEPHDMNQRDLECIGALKELTRLEVGWSDEVLDLSPLSSLTSLKDLSIGSVPLSAPSGATFLANLTCLTALDIRSMDGCILGSDPCITNLRGLKTLGCSYEGSKLFLRGRPSPELMPVTSLGLFSLRVQGKSLQYDDDGDGNDVRRWMLPSNLASIDQLSFEGQVMSNSLWVELAQIPSLTNVCFFMEDHLNIAETCKVIGKMTNLRTLSVMWPMVCVDHVPWDLSRLIYLETLRMMVNGHTMEDIESIAHLTRLHDLQMKLDTADFGLELLGSMTSLRRLTLHIRDEYHDQREYEEWLNRVLVALYGLFGTGLTFLCVTSYKDSNYQPDEKYTNYANLLLREYPKLRLFL